MTVLSDTITSKQISGVVPRTLTVAYTPDSDDAFNYFGWEFGHVGLETPDYTMEFARDHIIALNRAATQQAFDVVGVSSVAYPALADRYAVLSVGNSVGRGYGPVLVSKHYKTLDELRGKRVAVAGIPTTGGALAMMFCPGAQFIEHRYDLIADAIVAGDFDAGVMIHEELLFYGEKGLNKVADLGAAWSDDTGLPLPVGLNIVRRELGEDLCNDIARTCRRSLRWSKDHFDEAFKFASQFGRGCAAQHVEMFSNDDTMNLPDDVRRAMRVMFDRVNALGVGPKVDRIEVVDG
jgi:5,8-dihydroxy-2-naphthoate synthase